MPAETHLIVVTAVCFAIALVTTTAVWYRRGNNKADAPAVPGVPRFSEWVAVTAATPSLTTLTPVTSSVRKESPTPTTTTAVIQGQSVRVFGQLVASTARVGLNTFNPAGLAPFAHRVFTSGLYVLSANALERFDLDGSHTQRWDLPVTVDDSARVTCSHDGVWVAVGWPNAREARGVVWLWQCPTAAVSSNVWQVWNGAQGVGSPGDRLGCSVALSPDGTHLALGSRQTVFILTRDRAGCYRVEQTTLPPTGELDWDSSALWVGSSGFSLCSHH